MKLVLILLAFFNIICFSAANAAVISIKEAIIPSGYKSINLVCTVSGLYKSEIEEQTKLVDQINFKVGAEDKPIARSAGSKDHNYNLDLYWQSNASSPELLAESSDKYKITYNVTIGINNNDENTIKILAESGSIPIKAVFLYKDKNGATVEGRGTASLFNHNPIEAPTGFKVLSIHKGLDIEWEKSTAIKHSDSKAHKVSNMLVMLFKEGESEIDLQAKQAINTEGSDPDFSGCRYVAGEEHCIQCEGDSNQIYISSDQADLQDKALVFKLVRNDKGGFSFNNLEPDTSYTIALQYQDGTKRSVCKVGTTILSLSLTESNGEEEGSLTDTRCFIATAAFGTPFHRHVEVFRWFRSNILLKYRFGKQIVSYYYKNSPAIANSIAKSERLRTISRGLLIIPAYILHGIKLISQNQTAALVFFAALLSVFLGLINSAKVLSSRKP
ncbi:MAG: CFI-box-CTERM domain-containing protein [Oligoflexales bacterium]